jgi:hypothetical protein
MQMRMQIQGKGLTLTACGRALMLLLDLLTSINSGLSIPAWKIVTISTASFEPPLAAVLRHLLHFGAKKAGGIGFVQGRCSMEPCVAAGAARGFARSTMGAPPKQLAH